ncbi:MAG: MAPEG family protein [Pseudomonadota bacterium]
MVPDITILYAGLLGLLAIALGAAAGSYRGKAGIDAGDGGDPELLIRMRRHANFVESAPLALILLGLLELQAISSIAIHVLGGMLVVGRILHAATFAQGIKSIPRGIGAGLTTLSTLVAAVWGIVTFF